MLERAALEREKRHFVSSLFPHLRLEARSVLLPARSDGSVPARMLRWDCQVHARMVERREQAEIEHAKQFSIETIGATIAAAVDMASASDAVMARGDEAKEMGAPMAGRHEDDGEECHEEEREAMPSRDANEELGLPHDLLLQQRQQEQEQQREQSETGGHLLGAKLHSGRPTRPQYRPPHAVEAQGLRTLARILASGQYREAPRSPLIRDGAERAPAVVTKGGVRSSSVLPLLRAASCTGNFPSSVLRVSFRQWSFAAGAAREEGRAEIARLWVEDNRKLLERALPTSVAFALARPSAPLYSTIADRLRFEARSEDRRQYVMREGRSVQENSLQQVRAEGVWVARGGPELAPLLAPAHGPLGALLDAPLLALVDAEWLIHFADSGLPLPRRQALPDEAFLSLHDLKSAVLTNHIGLPIICVSHPSVPTHAMTTLA